MAEAWKCDGCGWNNGGGALCERCGLALHYQLDPPLDMPRQPGLSVLPEFWLALVWMLGAVATLVLLLPRFGTNPVFVWVQAAGCVAASLSAFGSALWRRWFARLELEVPERLRAGSLLEPHVRLLPYAQVRGLHITISFHEQYFSNDPQPARKSRRLGRVRLNAGQPLRGRREHVFATDFLAPVPALRYTHLVNEMTTSALRVLGYVIPEAAIAAVNASEHGGFHVRLQLRRGLLVRRIERRVIIWSDTGTILVG